MSEPERPAWFKSAIIPWWFHGWRNHPEEWVDLIHDYHYEEKEN